MTIPPPSIKGIMKSMVPITRFNRGEASKIFEEVSQTGVKIVLKNNLPVAVLMDPESYEAMVELLEDYALYVEAEKRESGPRETRSQEQVLNDLGIQPSDLDGVDVELE